MQEKLIKEIDNSIGKLIVGKENVDNTCIFFKKADDLIKESIDDPESDFGLRFDENGDILKKYISEVHVVEDYNNKHYERPVIDLVQQGGGMYGIALLGYTYVMEKVGIRFYSYGGTSAGAINALFLASFPNDVYKKNSIFKFNKKNHQATKSEILTHIIANTDFSKFMERSGFVGKLQQALFKNYKATWLLVLVVLFTFIFLSVVYGSFSAIFKIAHGISGTELRVFDFIIGTLNVFALVLLLYILFIKMLGKNFGINKGDVFYRWADDLLKSININDTKGLYKNMGHIKLSKPNPDDKPRLVLITSNLTHNRIVKFPERAEDYWENIDNIKPASYLRATMSLPFIYKTFIPRKEHYYNQNDPENKVKREARFVDGGMLSNFPIREFHRNDGQLPRFPTFGVLLSERKGNESKDKSKKTLTMLKDTSLVKYIVSFLSTFRNFYDNDFLFGSKEIGFRIETVDTKKYNWLNFWMSKKDKEGLFLEGVEAALNQLKKFNWEEYIEIRKEEL